MTACFTQVNNAFHFHLAEAVRKYSSFHRLQQATDHCRLANAGPAHDGHESLSVIIQKIHDLLRLNITILEVGWRDTRRWINELCGSFCRYRILGLALAFLPASPNPSRGPVQLGWALPAREERVDLAFHDLAGRLVRLERLGPHAAGVHRWTWDGRGSGGRSLAAGAYFVRLLAGRHVLSRTLVRLAP